MVKKPNTRSTDEHLFRQQMADVLPLKTQPRSESRKPRARNHRPNAVAEATSPAYLPAPGDLKHIDSDDGSSHRKEGVQRRILLKLKRGHFRVGGQLDMHQMDTQTGHEVLLKFIADARANKLNCIRVIHGKGLRSENGPKLKLMAQQLLRVHPQVLAFTTCKPANGGTGATDVLLKST